MRSWSWLLSNAQGKQKGSWKIKMGNFLLIDSVSKKKKKKSHSLYCITRASKSCGIKSYYKERNWSAAPEPLQLHSFSLQPQDLEFRHKARLYEVPSSLPNFSKWGSSSKISKQRGHKWTTPISGLSSSHQMSHRIATIHLFLLHAPLLFMVMLCN